MCVCVSLTELLIALQKSDSTAKLEMRRQKIIHPKQESQNRNVTGLGVGEYQKRQKKMDSSLSLNLTTLSGSDLISRLSDYLISEIAELVSAYHGNPFISKF